MAKKKYPNIQWRDGVAQLEAVVKGQRIRESLHTSNLNEAIERRDKRMAEIKEGAAAQSLDWVTPGAAPKRYPSTLEYATKMISQQLARGTTEAHSKSGLAHQWKRLSELFPTVDAITNDSVAAYYYTRLKMGYRHVSVKRDIPLLKACVNKWGRKLHPEIEIIDWEAPRQPRHEEPDNTAGETKDLVFLKAWLESLHTRAKAQATVALCTGLRAEELRRVQPSWVKPLSGRHKGHVLYMPKAATKSGIDRMIALPHLVSKLIAEHFPIPENYKKHFVGAAKRLGHGDTVHLRDLRHTFKTEVGRYEPAATALVMGHHHHSGTSADIYLHQTIEGCLEVARLAEQLFLAPKPQKRAAQKVKI